MGVTYKPVTKMMVPGIFLYLTLILGVQAMPSTISMEGFEDVENEAIVLEGEEGGRSGRQLWDLQGHVINPILALNSDGSSIILYQGAYSFTQQCGIGKYGPIQYNSDGHVTEEIARINGTHPFRMDNGWPADQNEWPWQAALLNKGRQFCAGSLIDYRHILTAAHCVAHMNRHDVANLRIRLGAHYIERNESGTHESKAARVVRHKGFSQQTLHWDVAIITMETPAPKGTPKIRPVCLPSGSQTYADETATKTGWGDLREYGWPIMVLREATVKIWINAECNSAYGKAAPAGIESHQLCADVKGGDSCIGDSGGPLVMGMGSTWTQIGVVSWGVGCGKSHYPGVYTRVTKVIDWINKILRDY